MSKIIWLLLIVVLVVLIGTWPLGFLGKIFEYISIAFNWLANALNVFGWNGLL